MSRGWLGRDRGTHIGVVNRSLTAQLTRISEEAIIATADRFCADAAPRTHLLVEANGTDTRRAHTVSKACFTVTLPVIATETMAGARFSSGGSAVLHITQSTFEGGKAHADAVLALSVTRAFSAGDIAPALLLAAIRTTKSIVTVAFGHDRPFHLHQFALAVPGAVVDAGQFDGAVVTRESCLTGTFVGRCARASSFATATAWATACRAVGATPLGITFALAIDTFPLLATSTRTRGFFAGPPSISVSARAFRVADRIQVARTLSVALIWASFFAPSASKSRSAHTRSKTFFDSTFAVARACRATGTCFLACVASVPILTLAHRLASRSAHAFTMHFAALGTRLQVTRFSFPAYLAFALPVLHALATIGTRLRALMMGIEYRAVFAGVAIRACTFSFHALAMTSTQVLANRDAAVRTHPQSFARAGAISTASSVTAAIGRAGFLHASRPSPTLSRERRVDFDVVAFAFLRRYVARTVYDEADTARRSFKAWITRAFPAWCTSTMRHAIPRTNTQTARYSGPALGAHASFVFADTTVLADRVALFDITSRPLPVRVAMTRIRTV